MKIASILFLFLFYYSPVCIGQVIDVKGLVSRVLEKEATRTLNNSTLVTSGAYNLTNVTTTVEKLSKVGLYTNTLSNTYINYRDYQGMCNYYINPYKKSKCNNRLNYLMEAHSTVLGLVQLPGVGQINQGIKEQIMEKYVSISNTIIIELEQLKMEVDKETYYRQLFIK